MIPRNREGVYLQRSRADSSESQAGELFYGATMATTISDRVRQYVFDTYVVPARQQHFERVTVRAGDVAKALRLRTRMPLVCEAIAALKFQEQFGIKLLERTGSAVGSNALFTFHIERPGDAAHISGRL